MDIGRHLVILNWRDCVDFPRYHLLYSWLYDYAH